jgi:hypothetical protein
MSYINWFGQQIGFRFEPLRGFIVQLDVEKNQPVTPQSPTRAGIVRDAKWDQFINFTHAAIRDYFMKLTSPPPVRVLQVAYREFPELKGHLPWLIVTKAEAGACGQFDERFALYDDEIIPKDTDAYILNNDLEVFSEDDTSTSMNGLEAFLHLLDKPAYFLVSGEYSCETVGWKPGPLVREADGVEIYERGQFCVFSEGEDPLPWKPVLEDVYAFEEPRAYEIIDTGLIIGSRDPVKTIRAASGAAFGYHDDLDDSWQTVNDQYEESVERLLRALLGDVVPHDFTLSDLLHFVPRDTRLSRIELVYGEKPNSREAVVLVFEDRQTKTLKFF